MSGPSADGFRDIVRLIGKLVLGNGEDYASARNRKEKLSRADRKQAGIDQTLRQRREALAGTVVVVVALGLALFGFMVQMSSGKGAVPTKPHP